VTGGTGRTVRHVHSGLATAGLIPRSLKSSSGIFSRRALISAGVSFCSLFLPFSSIVASENVVGFSKFILSCCSPQNGQTRSFFISFSEMVSSFLSSSGPRTLLISSALKRRRPQFLKRR
jgi:hypothetical protein